MIEEKWTKPRWNRQGEYMACRKRGGKREWFMLAWIEATKQGDHIAVSLVLDFNAFAHQEEILERTHNNLRRKIAFARRWRLVAEAKRDIEAAYKGFPRTTPRKGPQMGERAAREAGR